MNKNNKKEMQVVVLPDIPSYQQLMVVNRWLLRTVIFLMFVIVLAGVLWLPSSNFLGDYKKITADDINSTQTNNNVSSDVDALKGQVVGLISGSIENKLNTLEQSLRTGTLTNSLGELEAIKTDVKMLRAYSVPTQANKANSNEQIMREMSQLKRLIYLTIASCALLFAAITGIWLRHLKKLPSKQSVVRYLHRHK
ncbi:hypothetical protein [Methylocucumis oryzae]|uniref:Uncharacterized protein n=1 Tax=Methylocucumis oryzae TaxID=1632867 RepID=A0A0F3IKR6_9GAMM|nr:hypothetical protein [Methylocucumis oryzae]KJV07335.1 hypothetical protein VZ94_05425 [Methylocucumis oryzae]